MSTGIIILIILVALAVIVGNLFMLRDSASMKMPSLKDLEDNNQNKPNTKSEEQSNGE